MVDITKLTQEYAGTINAVKILAIVVISAAVIFALLYYFMVIKKRKRWYISIWEQKSDGKLHMVARDILEERRVDKGRRTYYWLRRYKAEATPPPIDSTDRLENRDFADYLKIRTSFVPIQKKVEGGDFSYDADTPEKRRVVSWFDKAIIALRTNPKFRKKEEIYNRFVYVPIHKVPHMNIGYQQMEYDVDMMRINGIDNIDKMFADKMSFWQKWGFLIMLLAGIVFVIVLAYLAFEFAGDVVKQNIASSDRVTTAIEKLAQAVGIQQNPPAPPPG